MALGDYCTRAQLDSYIASANNGATIGLESRAVEIDAVITAASRMIDEHCGRIFYDVDTGNPAARVFAATDSCRVRVDDFHTLTSVLTDSSGNGTFDTTWTATDYQEEPLNGVKAGRTGWPTETLRAVGTRSFPVSRQARVEVTAEWGWSATPAEITQACLIQSHRLLRRTESPEGVLGFGEFGAVRVTSVDRDVETLINPFRHVSTFIPV